MASAHAETDKGNVAAVTVSQRTTASVAVASPDDNAEIIAMAARPEKAKVSAECEFGLECEFLTECASRLHADHGAPTMVAMPAAACSK